RTFGVYGDHVALFKSTKPVVAKGGALRVIFADDDRIWRIAGMGNRTGFTDPVWTFNLVASVVELMGLYTRWWTAIAEARRGPLEHGRDFGFDVEYAEFEPEVEGGATSVTESLGELKRLLDEGFIEPADYQAKKSEILDRM